MEHRSVMHRSRPSLGVSRVLFLTPLLLLLLAPRAEASQCLAFTTDAAFPGGSPGSILSTLLVAEEVGTNVGSVEVRDLSLKHPRVGALLIALYWVPYSEAPADLPLTAYDLSAASKARSVLKELQAGAGAELMTNVTFTETVNSTLGTAQPSLRDLTGTFRPASTLSVFEKNKLSSRGRWVLRIADMGEKWQERSIEFGSWTLVLCPPGNSSLPLQVELSMAQQAATDINVFRGAASGLGSATRLSALSGLPLAPAVGTLLEVSSSTTFKTQSELADQALATLIRGIDNFQTLAGLPYQPTPLINRWLPWVELFIGGSDFVFYNFVWPGKIVSYALQVALAVRMREAMNSRPANTTTGGNMTMASGASSAGGSSGSSATGSASSNNAAEEECNNDASVYDQGNPRGQIDGPNGPVEIDKQLLLDEMCDVAVGGSSWLFSPVPDREPSGRGSAGAGLEPVEDGDEQSSLNPSLQLARDVSWFPTVSTGGDGPLNFAARGPGALTAEGQRLYEQAQEAARRRVLERLDEDPDRPDPAFLDSVMLDLENGMTLDELNRAFDNRLQVLVDRSGAVAATLSNLADNPRLVRAGGENARMAAQALSAGADTYRQVLQAGQDGLRKISPADLRNFTRAILNGSLTNAERNFRRFEWRLNTIRLIFRFAATDGPVVVFQQFLYQLSDRLAAASSGNSTANRRGPGANKPQQNRPGRVRSGDDADYLASPLPEESLPDEPLPGAEDPSDLLQEMDPDVVAALIERGGTEGGRRLLQGGLEAAELEDEHEEVEEEDDDVMEETPDEWFARVVREAEEDAAKIFKRIPIDKAAGLDRIVSG
ncbi:hypothetical protein GPECTOR_6g707 [Gonium pectorale]|uniref:P/Homo B domain-containing protein n=1 Tax=Gonium pectorale TaxID=33097 RepID=A0A150GVB7_GONPE|nr:hypothetical protein GPECTOR_6g707 [Gonium pectorale]|eukprot:KXZ53789.1 hypothetical protein GPECTOR_6g707 [Gonium pectorale]